MISTRGTMTSEATRLCSLRMLTSSVRSCGSIGCASSCSPSISTSAARKPCACSGSPRNCRSHWRRPDNGPSSCSSVWSVSATINAFVDAIGVGDAERGEDTGLECFHTLGRRSLYMIIAEKMQDAVDHEMTEMIGQTLVLFLRLARDRLVSQHDIAEQHRFTLRRRLI